MNKKFTALLMALLLALTLCVPAMAVSEYGVIYDETDSLGSVELDYMGEHALPELSEKLQMDLRIDVFTDENVSADTPRQTSPSRALRQRTEKTSMTSPWATSPSGNIR